jgi:hypothetical protein
MTLTSTAPHFYELDQLSMNAAHNRRTRKSRTRHIKHQTQYRATNEKRPKTRAGYVAAGRSSSLEEKNSLHVLHIQPRDYFNISNINDLKERQTSTLHPQNPQNQDWCQSHARHSQERNQRDEAYQIPTSPYTVPAPRRSQTQPFGIKVSTTDSW